MLFNWNENSLKSGVYQIRNLTNGKVYIGSAKEFKSRGKSHLRSLERGKHSNKHLQSAFNKDGTNNFVFEVLEVVDGDNLTRTTKEKDYLDQYLNKWEECYNFQKNPLSNDRTCWSKTPEETRKKISSAMKKRMSTPEGRKQIEEILAIGQKMGGNGGKTCSVETKKKMSLAKVGKKKSDETKKRMSLAQKGRNITDAHKQKISLTMRKYKDKLGKKKSIEITNLYTNETTKYCSIKEAAQKSGIHRTTIQRILYRKQRSKKWKIA